VVFYLWRKNILTPVTKKYQQFVAKVVKMLLPVKSRRGHFDDYFYPYRIAGVKEFPKVQAVWWYEQRALWRRIHRFISGDAW
jgi:hypothetical protein